MNRTMQQIVFLILLLASTLTFAGSIAEYVNVADPKTYITLETQPDRFVLIDVASNAIICSPKDKFICFETAGFQFAVPYDLSDSATWTFKGINYKVSKKLKSPIMGKDGPFWLIEQSGEHTLWFVYSKISGLIMLGGLGQPGGAIFMLVQSCGFGASVNCSQ